MIHTLEQTIKGHLAPDFDRLTPIMQINILSTTISTLDEMSGTRDESLMEAINNDNHVLDALRERLVALKMMRIIVCSLRNASNFLGTIRISNLEMRGTYIYRSHIKESMVNFPSLYGLKNLMSTYIFPLLME